MIFGTEGHVLDRPNLARKLAFLISMELATRYSHFLGLKSPFAARKRWFLSHFPPLIHMRQSSAVLLYFALVKILPNHVSHF